MYFFTFYGCVFLFVKDTDGSQGPVLLHNKDVLHIQGITQGDALFCKAAVHFIFNMDDDNDAVCGNTAFQLQKETLFDLMHVQTADLPRFGKNLSCGDFPCSEEWAERLYERTKASREPRSSSREWKSRMSSEAI